MPNLKPNRAKPLAEFTPRHQFTPTNLRWLQQLLLEAGADAPTIEAVTDGFSKAATSYNWMKHEFEAKRPTPAQVILAAKQIVDDPSPLVVPERADDEEKADEEVTTFDEETEQTLFALAAAFVEPLPGDRYPSDTTIRAALISNRDLRIVVRDALPKDIKAGRLPEEARKTLARGVAASLAHNGFRPTRSHGKLKDMSHTGKSDGKGLYCRVMEIILSDLGEACDDLGKLLKEGTIVARFIIPPKR